MTSDNILFLVYLIGISCLLLYTGFFKLFDDSVISRKKITLLFLGKALAVPAFLLVYTHMYGGIADFDTGKFFNDVVVISEYGKTNAGFLFRVLFGLQDDSPGSDDHKYGLIQTMNWDNGTVKDYFYNDNRVVIRTHILLNFLAFNSYPVHALLNSFLSFTGIFFLYKSIKEWFRGKEIWVLLTLCFFPALWFYTGALLKEGITFFVLGCLLYQLSLFSKGERFRLSAMLWFLFLCYVSLLLKPYLLLFSLICFSLFFIIQRSRKMKNKPLWFLAVLAIILFACNLVSIGLKNRNLLEAALKQQHRFVGVSKGGIFLADSLNFIRLSNDSSQIKRIQGKDSTFNIRKHVSYMYWQTEDQKDTLYCHNNQDTSTTYQLVYIIQPANSNIELPYTHPLLTVGACFYYTLFHPTFLTAKGLLHLLAAFENLIVLAALVAIGFGAVVSKKEKLLPLCFLVFALGLCVLIGLTAPNSGAIFRYRSPAVIFILLAALYFLEDLKTWFVKNISR